MNLSVEHVLMFALVFCAFYYMTNRCGCKEGVIDDSPEDTMMTLLDLQDEYTNELKGIYDPDDVTAAVDYYEKKNMYLLGQQINNSILLFKKDYR